MKNESGILAGMTIDEEKAAELKNVADVEKKIAQGKMSDAEETMATYMGLEPHAQSGCESGIKDVPENAADGNVLKGVTFSDIKEAEMDSAAELIRDVEKNPADPDEAGKTLEVAMGIRSDK